MSARAEAALREWVEQLPALGPSIDRDAETRKVLLGDAAAAGDTLLRAGRTSHPVLLGHAHLSVAALDLALALDGDDRERRVSQVLEHSEAALEIAEAAVAPVLRVTMMPRVAALMAACLPLSPKGKAAALERRTTEVAEAVGVALGELADEARRGVALLSAAMTLEDGAKLVRLAASKAAVLERASRLAGEARLALLRAGELRKADVAAEVQARLAG